MRTLIESKKSERLKRITALKARELGRYQIDIAALSKTRFSDKGHFTEIDSDYTCFWSGRNDGEQSRAEVGFAVKKQVVKKLDNVPEGLNAVLGNSKFLWGEKICFPHKCIHLSMTNPDDVKNKF